MTAHGRCAETGCVTPSTRSRLAWLALTFAALLPRALGAALRRPWHDEYFTFWLADQSWRAILDALRLDSGPPLFYAATKLVAQAGVPALAAARSLTVVAGVAAVLLGARAARHAFGTAAGWWCGVLLALHPLAIAWSAEGRAYAFLLLGVAWAWERLEAEARGTRAALGLGLATALACWSHAFGLILAGALAVAALTLATRQRQRALLAVALGAATHLPWLPIAVNQPPAATEWMVRTWNTMPVLDRVLAPVRLLPPLAPYGGHLDVPSWGLAAQLLGAALALALLLPPTRSPRPWLLFGLPAAGLFGLAVLKVPAFYPGRGEALYLLPFLGLLAAGSGRNRAKAALAVVIAGAGGLSAAVALRSWQLTPARAEERIAQAIRTALPAGGTVVIGGYWRLGVWYHLSAQRDSFTLVNVPGSAGRHPGWYEDSADRPGTGELKALAKQLQGKGAETAVIVTPGLATSSGLMELARGLGLRFQARMPAGLLFLPVSPSKTAQNS